MINMARYLGLTLFVFIIIIPHTKLDETEQLLSTFSKLFMQVLPVLKAAGLPIPKIGIESLPGIITKTKSMVNSQLIAAVNVLKHSADGQKCYRDIQYLTEATSKGDQWAVKTFDSWGKIGNGLAQFHFFYHGKISMCLHTRPASDVGYSNHYCYLDLAFPLAPGAPFRTAICVPQSCSSTTLDRPLNTFQAIIKMLKIVPYLKISSCYSHPKTEHFTTLSETLAIITCALVITIVVAGTLYDLLIRILLWKTIAEIENNVINKKIDYQFQGDKHKIKTLAIKDSEDKECSIKNTNEEIRKRNERKQQILKDLTLDRTLTLPYFGVIKMRTIQQPGFCGKFFLSFSVIKNLIELGEIKSSTGPLGCLHGIRVFSIGWVVMSHTISHLYPHSDNMFEWRNQITPRQHLAPQMLTAGYYAVDSFFVLSGILLTYLFMRAREKGIKFTWVQFYLDRFVRLSPGNWFMLFVLYWGLLSNNPQGPADLAAGNFIHKACPATWWYYIIYINNFIDTQECFGIDWYLGNDMQFYWVSPFILILFLKIGVWVSVLFVILIVISGWISIHIVMESQFLNNNFPLYDPMQYPNVAVLGSRLYFTFYMRPYCRIGSYLMGMFVGWLLFKINCNLKLSKAKIVSLWVVGCLCILFAFYSNFVFQYSKTGLYIFIATSHYVWSLGLAIIIFLCCSGGGGIINSFLAWPGWMPFSKLSYSVYLMHFIVMKMFYFNTDEIFHLTIPDSFIHFTSLFIFDYGGALALYLVIEAPFINLRNILLK